MMILYIALGILALLLLTRHILLCNAIRNVTKQIDEIEKNPESNHQILSPTSNFHFEKLLVKINLVYEARQKERIQYQRRENEIRQEIENISHDLRTPLTSILGYIELIEDNRTNETQKAEYLEIIRKRARILQGFIQDFYELSRIEAEDYPLLLTAVTLNELLAGAAVSFYHEFEKRNIHVKIDMEEESSTIIADQIQLNRVFNNIIQNALKYSKSEFGIRQYTTEKECRILFQNDADEMAKGELVKIFERFYTGDTSRNSQSTGLGLTITKLLVQKMNGRIEADRKEDKFTIELCFPKY